MNVWAVIVAAGLGKRAGLAKQFAHIAGDSVLRYAVRPFLRAPDITQVRVVVAAGAVTQARDALLEDAARVEIMPNGGRTRTDSVRGGLVDIADDDWVLVHDGARPCLADDALARLLAVRSHAVGGLLSLPLRDALKQTDAQDMTTLSTLPKSGKFLAQTPQMFRAGMLRLALAGAGEFDDEAQAIELAGYTPLLVMGDAMNIKITDKADFQLADAILTMRATHANKTAA